MLTHSHAEGQSGMNIEWLSEVNQHNQPRSSYASLETVDTTMSMLTHQQSFQTIFKIKSYGWKEIARNYSVTWKVLLSNNSTINTMKQLINIISISIGSRNCHKNRVLTTSVWDMTGAVISATWYQGFSGVKHGGAHVTAALQKQNVKLLYVKTMVNQIWEHRVQKLIYI